MSGKSTPRGAHWSARERQFSLGDHVIVDTGSASLVRNGSTVRLEPRVMELLAYLAASPGRIISKSELMEQVWQATVVDEAIHRAVSLLRNALGDDAREPKLLETVPRKGYRLLVEPQTMPQPVSVFRARAALAAGAVAVVAVFLLVATSIPLDLAPAVQSRSAAKAETGAQGPGPAAAPAPSAKTAAPLAVTTRASGPDPSGAPKAGRVAPAAPEIGLQTPTSSAAPRAPALPNEESIPAPAPRAPTSAATAPEAPTERVTD